MDNLSHSLVGVLTAESALTFLRGKNEETEISPKMRVSFWIAAFIGSNLPDFDIIFAWFLKPRTLQYLLQHRGYSHTFFLVPFLAIAITSLFLIWGRWKKSFYTVREIQTIYFVSLMALALHIVMDGFNVYGIHPFWPFDNQWYFGDALFIVEPWIWFTLIPLGFFASRDKYLRAIHIAFWVVGFVLIWFSHFVPTAIAIGLSLWGTFMGWQMKVAKLRTRVQLSFFSLLFVTGVFATVSFWLKQDIRRKFSQEQPGVLLQDVMLSPLPSNPFCWNVICLESYATRSSYRLRRGMIGILPSIYSPADCMQLYLRKKPKEAAEDRVIWTTDQQFSRQELLDLRKRSCQLRAHLKFLRAPFWRKKGSSVALSDMRFDMSQRGNFTTIEVDPGNEVCPDWVPNWIEPRRDLLED